MNMLPPGPYRNTEREIALIRRLTHLDNICGFVSALLLLPAYLILLAHGVPPAGTVGLAWVDRLINEILMPPVYGVYMDAIVPSALQFPSVQCLGVSGLVVALVAATLKGKIQRIKEPPWRKIICWAVSSNR